jgi:excisionase family DNA binding protein
MVPLVSLVTVEQAAAQLHLHPKTVLRYIRDGRLPATRVGKSYRIAREKLDAFAGVASTAPRAAGGVRATCVVDIPDLPVEAAERMATFLQSAALASPVNTPPLHIQTMYDPGAKSMKVVLIASPTTVAALLEMLQVQLRHRG